MPHSFAQIWLHVIFSTKHRRPFLLDADFREAMFRMLAYHIREAGCVVASVGGHFDHVHLLLGLSRSITIAKVVERVKAETSKWAKKAVGGHEAFSWQAGYAAFSVSHSIRGSVDRYIRNQEEHHAKRSFAEEYRLICRKHEVAIDERYVWE